MMLAIFLIFCAYSSHGHNNCSRKNLPCDVTLRNHSVYLDCSSRKLQTVPNICLWNTTHLNLSNNKIKNVTKDSFCNLPNVTFINLKGNVIHNVLEKDNLFFSGLDALKVLRLDGNYITSVPTDIPAGLQNLSLNDNQINTIRPSDFATMKNITEFKLSNNCYYRTCKMLLIQNGTFSELHHLTSLFLQKNKLQKIPAYLPHSLLKLSFRQNMIEHVEESKLKHLTNLQFLDLSGNCPICHNAPFPCKPCKTNMNSIQIDTKAFYQLTQLEELRLSGNSLQSLKPSWFKKLRKLKYLYLSFNFLINDIKCGQFFSFLPHLEVIDLSYNNPQQTFSKRLKLAEGFSQLTSLKSLHLEGYVFSTLCECDLKPLFSLKNLTVLNLGINFLQQINLSVFKNFQNLSVISLIDNQLTFISMEASKQNEVCVNNGDSEDSEEDNLQLPYIHIDTDFRHYPPFVKPECVKTGKVLDLSRNNMYFINPEFLQVGRNITCLNLSNNAISSFFNGTEFIHFPNLKYLDLSHNRVYLRSQNAFNELKNLEVLDLSHNKHYFEIVGLSHTLGFLNNLDHLKVLNLSWNEINTLSDSTMNSSSLTELRFQGNRLDIMWKKEKCFKMLFTFLKNLTHLDISFNKLKQIPNDILIYFPTTLKYLNMNRNQLAYFYWEHLIYLPQLEILDLSKNKLCFTNEMVSVNTNSLKILDLSHNMISTLEANFLKNATSLWTLDLSFNQLEMITETAFQLHNGNYLKTLYLKNNPFCCTCDLLDFVLWLENSEVVIPHFATGVLCNLPAINKGLPVISLDLKYSCTNDSTAQMLYILSCTIILVTIFSAVTLHQFYWDVSYILMLCKAKLRSYNPQKMEIIYDAFVMYDTKDPFVSDWVLNHLRVELEDRGERIRPLCLEERDWTPGSSIMENLNQSIRWSRKTVFVLTESFVLSAIFKVAASLSQQRLLEEGMDVMVLILLEPVLQHSRILQLRRCLCGNSVLEWPQNASAEKWFWQSLRNAIRKENHGMQNKLFKNYFNS